MRISDWSSDVCSSDLSQAPRRAGRRCSFRPSRNGYRRRRRAWPVRRGACRWDRPSWLHRHERGRRKPRRFGLTLQFLLAREPLFAERIEIDLGRARLLEHIVVLLFLFLQLLLSLFGTPRYLTFTIFFAGAAPGQFGEARADGIGRHGYIVTSAAGGSPAVSA